MHGVHICKLPQDFDLRRAAAFKKLCKHDSHSRAGRADGQADGGRRLAFTVAAINM